MWKRDIADTLMKERRPGRRVLVAVVALALLAAPAMTAAGVNHYSGKADFPHVGKFRFRAVVHRGEPVKVTGFQWSTTVLCWKREPRLHDSIHYRVHGRLRFGLEVRNRKGARRFWGRAANGTGKHTHVRGYFIPGDPSEHRVHARGVFKLYGNLDARLKHCRTPQLHWRASLPRRELPQ